MDSVSINFHRAFAAAAISLLAATSAPAQSSSAAAPTRAAPKAAATAEPAAASGSLAPSRRVPPDGAKSPGLTPPRPPDGAVKPQPPTTVTAKCVPPSGEAIGADQILKDLSEGKDVLLKGRVIEGSLDADAAWPQADERRASLRVVRGSLRLESCRINGRIAFRRCVFMRSIELPCTEIRGDLDLADSEAHGGIDASRSQIQGELRLGNMIVGEDLSLVSAVVDDRVDMTGAWVRGSVSLDGGEFKKDVDIERLTADDLDLAGARIGGRTLIRDVLALGAIEANDVAFGRGLVLTDVQVLGRLDLSDSVAGEAITLSRVVVGEDLLAPLSTKAPVMLEALTIGHDLSLFEGRFAALTIDGVLVKGTSEIEGARFSGKVVIRNSHFGQKFSALDAVFDGDCEFRNVHFLGQDPMSGALFARAPVLVETVLPFPPVLKSAADEEEEPDTEYEPLIDPK